MSNKRNLVLYVDTELIEKTREIGFNLSLVNYNIDGFFRVVIGPQIAGAPQSKKSPEMWRFALKGVGSEPDEVLHVDDDYETWILGAKKAGIQPVLIDRKGVHSSIDDCIVIHDLTEVLGLL